MSPKSLRAWALLLYDEAHSGAALTAKLNDSIERFKSLASAAFTP